MSASDKKNLEAGVATFFAKKNEYRSLSNFWEGKVVIVDEANGNQREYANGECCFQGEKFTCVAELLTDEKRRAQMLEYGKKFLLGNCDPDGAKVKKMGRQFTLTDDELSLWSLAKPVVQMEICEYKIKNYEEVRADLRKSVGKILVHPALRCSEDKIKKDDWFGKAKVVDGKFEVIGGNMLGQIWMDARDLYLKGSL
uniref:NADAR domain-containing protein n=1 Tax=viral metagenome TaxID=1070528 RepID=A0A6C0IRM1_9ZZZZ